MKTLRPNDYENFQYDRLIERMGKVKDVDVLGSGCFGTVFNHPTDPSRVIKVGPLTDGWLIWAAFCQINRGTSAHLPVIHSITRWEKHGLYVAVMERLDSTLCSQSVRMRKHIAGWEKYDNGWNKVKCWFSEYDGIECERRYSIDARYILIQMQNQASINTTAIYQLLETVRKFAKDNGLGRDLHDENVMLRANPDGTTCLVVTDPFSSGSKNKIDYPRLNRSAV